MGKRVKSTHKEGGVRGNRGTSLTDLESYSTSASSTDDTSPERTKRRRRRTPSSRNARKNEELLTCSQDNEILLIVKLLNVKFDKQSKQNKDDISEIRKELQELIENKDDTVEMRKQLEKVLENQNVQSKELEKLRKQLELHTNGTSHASDAPRSQSNQLQPPRYRLVFTSGNIDTIEKGQTIDISVALVEGNNDQTVENGPLASATVELVVVNAEFNEHDNQHNWSREDFESYVKKPRRGNVDQSARSIVSNGRFNLVDGAKCHRGSTIFENSSNKKVRLGVIVVSPTEERVLEGLSNSFFVRGHDRPGRQNNLCHNSSNRQRQPLVDNDRQEQNSPMPNLPQPSRINSTQTTGNRLDIIGGQSQPPFSGPIMLSTEPSTSALIPPYLNPDLPTVDQAISRQNGQALVGIDYQEQNSPIPNLPHQSRISSTQTRGNSLDIIGGQSQPPFPGTNTLSTEPSTNALISPYLNPDFIQWMVRQNDKRFTTNPTTLAVQLVWDRPNVELSKRHWNLLDQLMPLPKFNNCGLPTTRLMQEHLDSLTIISKEVMQIRRNRGVIIEPLEPDDSDEERQLKRKMRSKYKLRFVNKVCGAYHTRDPIKADDGSPLKVALFDENNIKITYGPLSSASVQIVVLHGDFNDHGQDYWTSEEFSRYEVCPRSGEVVLGGNCILVLADGEACLGDAFFQMTSYCARTAKFKMGIRLASAQEERIQEGVSEQFWVKYRHFAGKALVDNDYQEQNNPMPNLPYRSQINAGNRLDIIWGRSQLPFPGSNMLSTEPSTSDASVKKGPWTPEEDKLLVDYIKENGHGSWRRLPKLAGLNRCGKSCRLSWTNYLRPDIKRDHFTDEEEKLIIHLLSILGNKWSSIAPKLPGRTDNEIKNYWYTHLRKKLLSRGIDPVTHRPPNLLAGIPNLLAAGIPNLAAAAQTTWDISTPCGEKTPASSPFEGLGNLNLDDEFNSDSSCRDLLEYAGKCHG